MSDRECTLADVEEALAFVSPESRDTWISMLHAIKEEFGEAGVDVADSWSQGGSTYKEKTFRTVWKGIRPTKCIGIGPLFKAAIDNGFKFKPRSDEDRQRLAREAAERWRIREAEAAQEAARIETCQRSVAELCQRLVDAHMKKVGRSPYLGTKGVKAYGLWFMAHSVVAWIRPEDGRWGLITGKDEISEFFDKHKQYDEDTNPAPYSFRHLKPGTIGVPLVDGRNQLQSMQFIFASGRKSFFRDSRKQGLFHLLGNPPAPSCDAVARIWVAEGYATAASVHMAMNEKEPVAMAIDSGNLLPVGRTLAEVFAPCEIVFAADNDHDTQGNPGVTKANEAAEAVGGRVVVPDFSVLEKENAEESH